MAQASLKDIKEETEFVEGRKARNKARGIPVVSEAAIRSEFQKAKRQKAAGGASTKPVGILGRTVRALRGV